ncbi:hypothetical protein M3Y99_02002200 [Aphelenchoides fujianensis]|nr:hypothetical protein M3Y99_02002200 [Aphelenchoides fujianensis]
MAFCEHSTYLSTVHSVAYHGADVQSSKVALLFRPGMIFSLVLTASCSTLQHVKIALEGSVEGLKGAIWTHDKKGDDLIFLEDVQLNENYWIALSPNSRVFCRVWTDECPFFECKLAQQQAAHKKELQTLRSQLKQSETRLIEQRWRAENSQKALESRIQQLEQEAADNERKLATAVDENDSFKQQMEESLAKISELTAALEEQKAAGEAAAAETLAASKALENEVVKKEVRIDSLKDQLTKQREGAKKTKQQLRSHIQAMEEKMVDKKRNYVSVISSLESKCEGLQKEAKIAAKSRAELVDRCALLENEVSELKSALSDEQARAEIEAERKERADELATLHEKLASVEKAKETLEEEIECMRSQVFNFKPVGDGERQDASAEDNADDQSDSTSSSEFERIDAQ